MSGKQLTRQATTGQRRDLPTDLTPAVSLFACERAATTPSSSHSSRALA